MNRGLIGFKDLTDSGFCHPREGDDLDLDRELYRGIWIPAFAGMTEVGHFGRSGA